MGCDVQSLFNAVPEYHALSEKHYCRHNGDDASSVDCEPCISDLLVQAKMDWYRQRYPDVENNEHWPTDLGTVKKDWQKIDDPAKTDDGVPKFCFRNVTIVRTQARDYSAYAVYHLRETQDLWDQDGISPSPKWPGPPHGSSDSPTLTALDSDEPSPPSNPLQTGVIYKIEWKITYHNRAAWLLIKRPESVDKLATLINQGLSEASKSPGRKPPAWKPVPHLVQFAGDPNVKGPDIVYVWPDVACTVCGSGQGDSKAGARMIVAFGPTDNSISIEISFGTASKPVDQGLWNRARNRYLFKQVLRFAQAVASEPQGGTDSAAGESSPPGP
ncbi:MAG: hypothetical protein WAW96_21925 [Alphaproteobacteria bacterium]